MAEKNLEEKVAKEFKLPELGEIYGYALAFSGSATFYLGARHIHQNDIANIPSNIYEVATVGLGVAATLIGVAIIDHYEKKSKKF